VVERYGALGVPEVVLFDPSWEAHGRGYCWQVFRRVGRRGLVRVDATRGDRVRSKALGCWLRAVGQGRDVRVRIALGSRGDAIVPTGEEAERAAKEQERAAKEAALTRVRELEAQLRRLMQRKRRG
jgi:hypothetical protein